MPLKKFKALLLLLPVAVLSFFFLSEAYTTKSTVQAVTAYPDMVLFSSTSGRVLLHNDITDSGSRHVYVENGIIPDAPDSGKVMVRVKLSEYFQIGNETVVGENAIDKTTWKPHVFGNCNLKSHGYYTLSMPGSVKNFLRGINSNTDFYNDSEIGSLVSGYEVAQTLPASPVITMETYLGDPSEYSDETATACWVSDSDGWFYWSKLLTPGDATNLLLDEITPTGKTPGSNSQFALHVQIEAQLEENMNYDDMSGNAMILTATAINDSAKLIELGINE